MNPACPKVHILRFRYCNHKDISPCECPVRETNEASVSFISQELCIFIYEAELPEIESFHLSGQGERLGAKLKTDWPYLVRCISFLGKIG